MAAWRASGGAAFDAFDRFSQQSGKYDAAATVERWEHYPRSPPSKLGAGTLFYLARQAVPGWQKPSEERRRTEPIEPTYPATNVQPAGAVRDAIEDTLRQFGRRAMAYYIAKADADEDDPAPIAPADGIKTSTGTSKSSLLAAFIALDTADRPLRHKPATQLPLPLALSSACRLDRRQDERSPAAVLMHTSVAGPCPDAQTQQRACEDLCRTRTCAKVGGEVGGRSRPPRLRSRDPRENPDVRRPRRRQDYERDRGPRRGVLLRGQKPGGRDPAERRHRPELRLPTAEKRPAPRRLDRQP